MPDEFDNLTIREKQMLRQDRIMIALNSLPPAGAKVLVLAATMVRHAIELGKDKLPNHAVWAALEKALTDNDL